MLLEYKLYCVDGEGHIILRHDFHARDDVDSLELVKIFLGPNDVEIWQGTRMVARVKEDGTASFAATTEEHVH